MGVFFFRVEVVNEDKSRLSQIIVKLLTKDSN